MQFGSKPLFENISVKFGGGNRYGLIGANGSGKSTFMKILGGDLMPTAGNVSCDPNERIGKLRQDQFAFEKFSVLDTVIMGHDELWQVKQERDRIYALPEMSEEDGYKVADLEVQYGEMDGYTAEARAGELLLGVGIPMEQHYGPMSEIAPGWKLRVLLAQALFSNPDILLLDEPTNDLDVETLELLEELIDGYQGTVLLVSHDRQFVDNTVTECWIFEGNGEIGAFVGGYHDAQQQRAAFRQSRAAALKTSAPVEKSAKVDTVKSDAAKQPVAKLSYKLQRELEQLPQQLEALETQIEQLQAQMADASFFSQPHDKTQPVLDALAEAEQQLESAFERWEYLESLKNGA